MLLRVKETEQQLTINADTIEHLKQDLRLAQTSAANAIKKRKDLAKISEKLTQELEATQLKIQR